MKTTKIIYWTTTIIIFLLDGLMPALTSNTELARQGISHLGYPDYFRVMLTFFKIAGAIVLVLPVIKGRYKEWAYAGFGINFICAATSHWIVDGFGGQVIFPLVAFAILAISYFSYHKINEKRDAPAYTGNPESSTLKVSGMSFQAYLKNIKSKTGKTPEDFKDLAEKRGLLKPAIKAGAIVVWLKEDFDLGHGHAMAIYAVLSGKIDPAADK